MINLITREWEIKNIDTVIFDKDGTFIDLHYFWGKMTEMRVQEIIKRYDLNPNLHSEICLLLGYDTELKKMLKDGITALYSRSKIIEIFKKDLLKYDLNLSKKNLEDIFDNVSQEFYKEITKYIKPIENAITFIKTLKQLGVKLAIVTSDSVESTNLTLNYYNWHNLFDVVIGRESSEFTKESGEPTKLALKKLQSNPLRTVMIGDAPMDFISAKNAEINNIILVSTGQIDKEELLETTDFVVQDLAELIPKVISTN